MTWKVNEDWEVVVSSEKYAVIKCIVNYRLGILTGECPVLIEKNHPTYSKGHYLATPDFEVCHYCGGKIEVEGKLKTLIKLLARS